LFAGVPAAKIGEDDATSAAVVALKAMEPLVEEYLLVGGFPEWFELRGTPDATRRWLERLVLDVPKKAIYEDIASYFGIRNPKVLDLLLTVIASNQGRILSYEKLNEAVRLNRATLLDYLEFLRSSYLLLEIPLHASPKKQAKAMKKFLLCDQGVRNAILKKTVPDPENAGFLVENVVGATLFRHCSQLTYWRDQSNEVDYVADGFPVEVKYQNSIGEPDAAGILRFLKESGGKNGAIITRHHKGKLSIKGKSISLVPFWEFLLDPQQVIMGVWSNPDISSTKH
jgi:predicted AAA+ superfamily ATPase